LKKVAASLFSQERERCFRDVNDTEQICFELGSKLGHAHVFNRANVAIARVVRNNIQSSEGFDCFSYASDRRLLACYVKSYGTNLISVSFNQILELFGIASGCYKSVAGSEDSFRKCTPKSSGTSSDEPNL
jgi:hypothetical protein